MRSHKLTALQMAVRLDRQAAPYLHALRADPCAYCGEPSHHLDHVDPTGADGWENLTAACKSCNSAKGERSLLAFLGKRINRVTERLRALEAETLAWNRLGAQA